MQICGKCVQTVYGKQTHQHKRKITNPKNSVLLFKTHGNKSKRNLKSSHRHSKTTAKQVNQPHSVSATNHHTVCIKKKRKK
jgi:hypothetical protein